MRKLPALIFSLILILASCGSSDDESTADLSNAVGNTSTSAARASIEGDSVDMSAEEPLGDGGADGERAVAPDGSLTPVNTGRDIIFTAFVRVEVENLAEASQLALSRIEGMGGQLYGQETTTEGRPRTVLIFKVAPQDFQAALRALGDVGVLREQNISANDVTERVVDLQSQIITSEASVERLRQFLSNATELNQIAQLERELLDRETTLERLRGQLRTLENQVALATITVTLTEIIPGPAIAMTETAYLGHDGGTTCGGDPELSIDEGDPFTLCIEIENVGDTNLTGIEIREEALKLKTDDFTIIEGTLDGTTAPGDTVELYYEATAEESLSGQAQATARPVDENGSSLGASVSARSSVFLNVDPDTSLPGFVEGFESGWSTLMAVIAFLILAVAFLIPVIPLLVLAWFGLRWARRMLAARTPKPEPQPQAQPYIPPPPPSVRQDVGAAPGPGPQS